MNGWKYHDRQILTRLKHVDYAPFVSVRVTELQIRAS